MSFDCLRCVAFPQGSTPDQVQVGSFVEWTGVWVAAVLLLTWSSQEVSGLTCPCRVKGIHHSCTPQWTSTNSDGVRLTCTSTPHVPCWDQTQSTRACVRTPVWPTEARKSCDQLCTVTFSHGAAFITRTRTIPAGTLDGCEFCRGKSDVM